MENMRKKILFLIISGIVCWYNGNMLNAQDVATQSQSVKKNIERVSARTHGTGARIKPALRLPAYVMWPLLSTTGANAETVSGLIIADSETFSRSLYRYGYNDNGSRWTLYNSGASKGIWDAETCPNFTRYAQYTIVPKSHGIFVATVVQFTVNVESSTNMRMALYVSNDSTFSTPVFIADTVLSVSPTSYTYTLHDSVASGKAMYLRFFPYNTVAEGAWRLVDVRGVMIAGYTTGLAMEKPTVITTAASFCSTTFITIGGKICCDGGGKILTRGVCWDTLPYPTIAKKYLKVGSGLGAYTSKVTELTAGKKYYLRAFATNESGTDYGNEISFTTLAAVVPPTVSTTPVTSIMAKTAVCGGTLQTWGGDSVTAKGVCWNTTGTATISDEHSIDGSGIGTFQSILQKLCGNTTYYVRAYATNCAGTGYGAEESFTTETIASDTTVVVAPDGSGNYTTLKAAFNAVPFNYTGKWTIYVKNGTYIEKDTLAAGKVHVNLFGESRDNTIISDSINSDSFGGKGSGNPGTKGTSTLLIGANDFVAKNITIRNTYAPDTSAANTQAVALMTDGDRQEYINCNISGYQDTYYAWGISGTGRMYFKNCTISGTVDFIFGSEIVVFDRCTIQIKRNGGVLTAASTQPTTAYGLVFRHCSIAADSVGYDGTAISSFYLGRPWQNSPRTVFLNCSEPSTLAAAGWLSWNVKPALYAEYHCYGAGSNTAQRAKCSSQLDSVEADSYTLKNIFARRAASSPFMLYDWFPANASSIENDIR
jgi:pectinesterase